MKLIGYGLRCLFLYVKKIFAAGNFQFIFPIKVGKNVEFSLRNGGKIAMKKHVSVNRNAFIAVTEDAYITIGNYSGIGANNVIVAREKITIGNNVMIGPNVCIYDHDHIIHQEGIMRNLGYETKPVTIEDNVWIGAGVTILKGVTIGTGSVVAAGTVVTKDVSPNSIIYNKRETVVRGR